MRIVSVGYCTNNENDEEELSFDYELNPVEWWIKAFMARSMRVPMVFTESWVARGTRWVNKETGIPADTDKQFELFEAKAEMKRTTDEIDY